MYCKGLVNLFYYVIKLKGGFGFWFDNGMYIGWKEFSSLIKRYFIVGIVDIRREVKIKF